MMNKPETTEDFPFGEQSAVFRLREKIYAILYMEGDCARVNLKCEPEQANALRDIFPSVIPGYHMNKKHWNTVISDGSIPQSEIERMIDHSYELIFKGLKKADQKVLSMKFGAQLKVE